MRAVATENIPPSFHEVASSPKSIGSSLGSIGLREAVGNPFVRHQEIVGQTVEVQTLSTSEENLGCLKIDTIDNMSIVPMSDQLGLRADFQNIEDLSLMTSENFDEFQVRIAKDPDFSKFRDKLKMLSPEQQILELKLFFAIEMAVNFFGKERVDGQQSAEEIEKNKTHRDETYKDYAVDNDRDDTLFVKPLSEAGKSALCTEYAVLVKEALRRLGSDFSYVAAEKQFWTDESSFYHSFLVSSDGRTVLDPLDAAQFKSKKLPRGLYSLPESFYSASTAIVANEAWSGRNTTYSPVRISGKEV